MNKTKEAQIIYDRLTNGLSFRSLALKYSLPYGCVYRMVKQNKENRDSKIQQVINEADLPDDIKLLKSLLRKERLRNELLNNIIDIADKELGTNIRKKSGTGQSE